MNPLDALYSDVVWAQLDDDKPAWPVARISNSVLSELVPPGFTYVVTLDSKEQYA
jgi:hypothetical protein